MIVSLTDYFFRFKSFIIYILKARYRGGIAVHSPLAYRKITTVFEETYPYYIYHVIENERKRLLRSSSMIYVNDLGTGKSGKRFVKSIARRSLKSSRSAQMFFRIFYDVRPKVAVELGTSLGITTAYLSKAAECGTLHTFEGSQSLVSEARIVNRNCSLIDNVVFHVGNINQTLPLFLSSETTVDAALIDANHTFDATLYYFNLLISHLSDGGVIIVDDIHYTKSMHDVWLRIIGDPKVNLWFDFYEFGVVYRNDKFNKKGYLYYCGV